MHALSSWREGWRVIHRVLLFTFVVLVVHVIVVVVAALALGPPIVLVDHFFGSDLFFWLQLYRGHLTLALALLAEPFAFFWASRLSGEFRVAPVRWPLRAERS